MSNGGHQKGGGDKAAQVVHELMVADKTGFHFLPASQLAKIAMEFEGTLEVEKDGVRKNARSALALIGLLAVPDKEVRFRMIVTGHGAEAAFEKVMTVLKGKLVVVDPPPAKGHAAAKPGAWSYLSSFWPKGK